MKNVVGFVAPEESYGDRAPALQAVVSVAEAIRPFLQSVRVDAAELDRRVDEHVVRLGIGRRQPVSWPRVAILRGPASLLVEHWERGNEWRSLVGRSIGEMHGRHSDEPSRRRLRPPIWPVGLVNVFAPVFVANEANYRRCRDVTGSPRELDACWSAVCFMEKLVDAELVWELFGDSESTVASPFAPLLSMCASNAIRVGWVDDEFHLYVFDSGRPTE
jgi:hypothetical protein